MYQHFLYLKNIYIWVFHRLLVFSRQTGPFTASSDVKFPWFITLSIFFPHYTRVVLVLFSLPVTSTLLFWPSALLHAYYVSIPFLHIVFHSLQECVTPIFLWLLHFLLLVVWRYLQLLSKNPFLYLTVYLNQKADIEKTISQRAWVI